MKAFVTVLQHPQCLDETDSFKSIFQKLQWVEILWVALIFGKKTADGFAYNLHLLKNAEFSQQFTRHVTDDKSPVHKICWKVS